MPESSSAGDLGRHLQLVQEHLPGDDGAGAAQRVVQHIDGRRRRDVADAVMVDDLQDLRFLDAVDRQRQFVMVDQDSPLAHRVQQVGTGDEADQAIVAVGDDRGAVVRFEHQLAQRPRSELYSPTVAGLGSMIDETGSDMSSSCTVA